MLNTTETNTFDISKTIDSADSTHQVLYGDDSHG